ncbi:organic solute transporter subunit alpha-like [Patiria miniata]|uniref:Organic solute transporter subunit alpha n=1 Tax=Patiria miniata TaxID=46514 RepID=A0A914B5Q4_PATMI|nr:organic solute transporter subunit alpha-like [Patiria miniata]XP_038071421.1 organic solute transporter subunit alpha-like [Patiria miniata]XP_038071423.1 organic solute transporter subunit alpha-like [Patiria miniata]
MAATNSCAMGDLTSEELFEDIGKSAAAITAIVLLTATSILTLAMFIESVFSANKKIPNSRRRVRLIIMMGIYPTMSVTSMISLYVPAAHLLNTLVASVYFSVALFQFLMLIIDYYGGKAAVVEKLKDQRISLASPPLTCCCPCWMPKITMTPSNLRNLRRIVMQVAFIRPLLFFISLVLWTDGKYTHGNIAIDEPYIYITTFSALSGLLALYGIILFLTASLEPLRSFRIRPKFFIVQMVLILISTQNLILAILADVYVIPCVAPFSSDSRANYIGDMMIIVEMLFFSVLSRMYFRGRFGNIDLIDVNAPMGGRLTSYGPYAVVTSDQEKPSGPHDGKEVEVNGNAQFKVENEKSGDQTTKLEQGNATEA